jgi:F-type H+-transporting ATPase subunit epsilon
METLNLEIVTPDGLIYSGEVTEVVLPGEEGEFGVLPNHVSLLTLLRTGIIEFTTAKGKTDSVIINSGNVTVDDNKVVALVDGAVAITGTDSEIEKALGEAKELLRTATDSKAILASVEAKIETSTSRAG